MQISPFVVVSVSTWSPRLDGIFELFNALQSFISLATAGSGSLRLSLITIAALHIVVYFHFE